MCIINGAFGFLLVDFQVGFESEQRFHHRSWAIGECDCMASSSNLFCS